ncbi:MAG TPA: 4-hydroxybenzoate octaprenyltransferase [Aeromonadales bacterium]|nr:4-hydroxybenzoate octaprenyltransferase [Aeromonadales bacterium]
MIKLSIKESKLFPYIQLMRLDKPIGTLLLLWPTLWAVWIAAKGKPDSTILTVFVLGVILMRAAGCVINDWADRHFDGAVKRTQQRPLATGSIPEKHALFLFVALCLFAFSLVLMLNTETIEFSFIAVALAMIYPFMKRFTFYPQVVLGAAFSWGIPMAFMATNGVVDDVGWVLFITNLLWTIAYDTEYAMVDRKDDLKIGIKSTAILFGDGDKLIIGILQGMVIIALLLVGHKEEFSFYFDLSIVIVTALFAYQQWIIRQRKTEACFKAFLNNQWVGLVVFMGIVLAYSFPGTS